MYNERKYEATMFHTEIKMYLFLNEGYEDWIQLAHYRIRWRALVNSYGVSNS